MYGALFITHRLSHKLCEADTIAPHIHVLYRDIPFILNIKAHPQLSATINFDGYFKQ